MEKQKSEYNVLQTTVFMIKQAAKTAPSVLVWVVVDALLALFLQLLELYVTPVLLRDIQNQVALKQLVITILLFSGGMILLSGIKKYLEDATYEAQIENRICLCKKITEKVGTTSYCNLNKKDFQEKKERAYQGIEQQWKFYGNYLENAQRITFQCAWILHVSVCDETGK